MQEIQGGFFPHPRHPGNVVAGIPHQRLQIDELSRLQPVLFPDGRHIVQGGFRPAHLGGGQQHRHPFPH